MRPAGAIHPVPPAAEGAPVSNSCLSQGLGSLAGGAGAPSTFGEAAVFKFFAPRPDEEEDASTKEGAERLKKKIETYWGGRGYAVNVSLAYKPFTAMMRAGSYEIRSDLVNGLPRALFSERRDAA